MSFCSFLVNADTVNDLAKKVINKNLDLIYAIGNRPFLFSRYRTGTSLQSRLCGESFQM